MSKFIEEIRVVINKHSKENGSDTPDFILAEYLEGCLNVFDKTVNSRESWYSRPKKPVFTESNPEEIK